MKRTLNILLIVFGLCLMGYLGCQLTWQIGFGMPGFADFYLHQSKYQVVVQTAKSLPLAPGAKTQLSISGLTVWVVRDRGGHYMVTMKTKDWGHAGDYGYTYSDAVLVGRPPVNYPQETTLSDSDDLPFVNRQINAHWWSVYNNLN